MIKQSLLLVSFLALAACGDKEPKANTNATGSMPAVSVSGTAQTLEAGCAACVYQMPGANSCALAVKVDGKPVLVTGVPRPGHDSGLCEHACQAEVTGQMEGDHFVAATFALKR